MSSLIREIEELQKCWTTNTSHEVCTSLLLLLFFPSSSISPLLGLYSLSSPNFGPFFCFFFKALLKQCQFGCFKEKTQLKTTSFWADFFLKIVQHYNQAHLGNALHLPQGAPRLRLSLPFVNELHLTSSEAHNSPRHVVLRLGTPFTTMIQANRAHLVVLGLN